MSDLKPCPFCGGEAEIVEHKIYKYASAYGVACLYCEAQTWQRYINAEAARKAWNRRVKDDNKHTASD